MFLAHDGAAHAGGNQLDQIAFAGNQFVELTDVYCFIHKYLNRYYVVFFDIFSGNS